MLLNSLMAEIGAGRLHRADVRAAVPGSLPDPEVIDVVLDDGLTVPGPGTIVVAVGGQDAAELIERLAATGAAAVVVPGAAVLRGAAAAAGPVVSTTPVVCTTSLPTTELFLLLTAALHGGDEAHPLGSVQAVADYARTAVGGAVVVYDRAHGVLAHSVGDHPIDGVRRDTILGRRTPEQWIARFSDDRTAYRTYADPGRVVRVDEYADLLPRLRVAVHSDGQVLGELSVSLDDHRPDPAAELALARAARLAVPALLAHERAAESERTAVRDRVRGLLRDGCTPPDWPDGGALVVGVRPAESRTAAASPADGRTGRTPPHGSAEELAHFVALSFRALSPGALVAWIDGALWAVLPMSAGQEVAVERTAREVAQRFGRVGVDVRLAVSVHAPSSGAVPACRAMVDDLLDNDRPGRGGGSVLTASGRWAQIALAGVRRTLTAPGPRPADPVDSVLAHDSAHGTAWADTLLAYLDEFGGVSAAAARLHLHPNSLRHRLARIGEHSGLDLDDPEQRLAAHLLLAARVQTGQGEHGDGHDGDCPDGQ